jgi:hypothetical protein
MTKASRSQEHFAITTHTRTLHSGGNLRAPNHTHELNLLQNTTTNLTMRPALQTARRHLSPRTLTTRPFSTTPHRASSVFDRGPAPPRLGKEDQELFEKLQKQSTGAFSQPKPAASSTPSPSTSTTTTNVSSTATAQSNSATSFSPSDIRARINQSPASQPETTAEGGVANHPHMRRGAPPEFEGDINPKTGEVGGPKNEPLRWGEKGDWSFNGRVTDF